MKVLECPVKENSPAVLTAYLHDVSPEMPQRTVRPAMLVLPGGGYHFCSDREAEPLALEWFQRGYQAFVLRYTVIDDAHPAPLYQLPLQDAAAAMALLRRNAAVWQLDAQKIAVIGFSAGGHLAATLGTQWHDAALSDENIRPDALVLCYPVISTREEAGFGALYAAEKLTSGEPEWLTYFAAEENVREDTPPALVWTTFGDHCVNIAHSLRFVQAMHQAGVACEFHLYDHGEHGYSLATAETAAMPTLPPDAHIASWSALAEQWLGRLFGWQK